MTRRASWMPLGRAGRRTAGALVVGLATLSLFLAAALSERALQDERLETELRLLASNFAARLETHLTARLNAGRLLGQDIEALDADGIAVFQAETALMHNLFRDLQALNWVDPEGVIRIVTPEDGNAAARGLDLRGLPLPAAALAEAERSGTLRITPPLTLAQGGIGFTAYLPVGPPGEIAGFLNIVFRAAPLMANALGEASGDQFVYRVLDGERLLYASAGSDAGAAPFVETRIEAANRTWRLQVAPRAALLAERASLADEALLVLGVLAGGLTAGMAWLLMRRQAELDDSRARLHHFATSTSDWFWEMDAGLRLTWFTDGVETIMGIPRAEILGKRRDEVRVPQDDDAAWDAHLADLEARRPFRDVQYAARVGDEVKWVRVSGVPRFDEHGAFIGYRGTASDVTDIVETRDAVQKASARLAAAVENLDALFSIWDSEDRLIFGNRKFRELNADVRHALVPGTRFETFIRACVTAGHMVGLEGREETFVSMTLARRAAASGERFEVTRSDGRTLLLHEQRLPDGGMVTTGIDITRQRANEAALRESEERLALAVQELSIWDWHLGSETIYLSPGFAEALGYRQGELDAPTSADIEALIHPDDIGDFRARVDAHLADPDVPLRSQHRFRTASGTYRWFLAIGDVHRDETGAVTRSTGVFTDVTERVELEAQLRQAQKMEAIGNLTGGVAHDFNNLLAVIMGNLELIRETSDNAEIDGFAEAGIAATRRGAELVRNMLSFARKARLEPRAIDLSTLVEETRSWCDHVLPRNIAVQTKLEPRPWTVEADPGLMQTALLNLVVNARDAMPDGGTLVIETRNEASGTATDGKGAGKPARDHVVLTVRDTGLGIPKDQLDAVFEPFFTTKPPGAGSGLGLSMVQGYVTQSGGRVCVRSEPGAGTTIALRFPAVAQDGARPSEKHPAHAAPDARGASVAPRSARRVLLVDDEPELRKVLEGVLRRGGYAVETAATGDAALALWRRDRAFDAVVTDVAMPGRLQGDDLARLLGEEAPDLPILVMSGTADDDAGRGAARDPLDAGDMRLMKPVSGQRLLDALAQALAQTAE